MYYHHKDIKERHFSYKMITFKNSVEKNCNIKYLLLMTKNHCHHFFFHFIPVKTSSVPMPSLRTDIWDLLINLIFIAMVIKTWCVQFWYSQQVLSVHNQRRLLLRGHSASLETVLVVTTGVGVPLASSEQRIGILLNNLHVIRQFPTRNYSAQKCEKGCEPF